MPAGSAALGLERCPACNHLVDIYESWNDIRDELGQYVLGHTDDDPMLELQFWKNESTGSFKMEVTFTVGGPTVWAEYDSRWTMGTFHHSWGGGPDGKLDRIHVGAEVLQALAEMAGYYDD